MARSQYICPLSQINAFNDGQVRRVYEHDAIVELAGSMSENDLLHDLTVLELPVVDAEEYVNDINELWNTEYSIFNMAQNDKGNYYMLIAGHRRLLSAHLNTEKGVIARKKLRFLAKSEQTLA